MADSAEAVTPAAADAGDVVPAAKKATRRRKAAEPVEAVEAASAVAADEAPVAEKPKRAPRKRLRWWLMRRLPR